MMTLLLLAPLMLPSIYHVFEEQLTPRQQAYVGLAIFVLVVILIMWIGYKAKCWRQRRRRWAKKGTGERLDFSDNVMQSVLRKQNHRCAVCRRLLTTTDFHHKNDDRSDNSEKNCQALCPNCHASITRRGAGGR